jgi:hypothetical protein
MAEAANLSVRGISNFCAFVAVAGDCFFYSFWDVYSLGSLRSPVKVYILAISTIIRPSSSTTKVGAFKLITQIAARGKCCGWF